MIKSLAVLCVALFAIQVVKGGEPSPTSHLTSHIESQLAYAGPKHDEEAVYAVAVGVNGNVLDVRKTKSSGIAKYDEAIETAIWKSSPLPKQWHKDGTRALDLTLVFNMKDVP